MIVIMKTTLAGPDRTASPGSREDFADDIAQTLIKGGFADPETATINPPEAAVMPRAKARRVKK